MSKSALIVDDDLTVLRNFSRLLREEGFEVRAVETGREAVAIERSFDVVLIDFRLPDMDGDAVLRQMSDRTKNSVIIMITGFQILDMHCTMEDLCIDAFVMKPIDSEELLRLIDGKLKAKTGAK
jgi:DNA-binding response OmpR family regulator